MTGRPVSSRGLGLGVIALSVYATACASSGATPRPFPMPGAPTARRAPATAPAAPDDPAAAPAAPATPSPTPAAPAPAAPRGSRTAFDGYALAGTALALRGIPYRNGGSDPAGFDCSGFTQYVFAQHGVALPREIREQFHVGKSVRPDDLVAGDIVFFTTTDPGPSHVAIAIGGDEFVHAPSSAGVVRVEHLSSSYWAPRFIGARRVN